VLNINQGRNKGIARGCKTLAEYQAFVAKAREYLKQGHGLEDALKKTVVYCRDHDILKEILEQYEREVIGMLTSEWNWEDALAVRFEEGMERGMEQGMEQGMERGMEQGVKGVARKMKAIGIPMEQINAATGLDPQIIESLK